MKQKQLQRVKSKKSPSLVVINLYQNQIHKSGTMHQPNCRTTRQEQLARIYYFRHQNTISIPNDFKQSQYCLSRLPIKQIFRLYKAYNFFIQFNLMNQQFELKLLLKQNSEMVSKIQVYRRQNQLLIQKNHDLNLWVQNLTELFAALGAAWKTITNNQEALFNLMKKRADSGSKALISKYVSHFKTFDEIIDNLGQKITSSGHSDEVTLDAKTRLNAFVQNYEMFFKEIVDGYFKFNDEYLQWIAEIKNKPQLSQNFRAVANKEMENKIKIKEFQSFMGEFRGRFKIYQSENQHKLLDGILFSKNQQINCLNQLNQKQTRRIHLMLDYSSKNAESIIHAQENDYECFCGASQLTYFKKQWEKHLEQLRKQKSKVKTSKERQIQTTTSMNRQEQQLLQFEKQKLFQRISNLQAKIQKMKTQSRLTEDLVLNSSAYAILHEQAQELLGFVDDLLHKINIHYNYLYEIQKSREEEILQLKFKLQKTESNNAIKNSFESPKIAVQSNLVEFKTTLMDLIKELTAQYTNLNTKVSQKADNLQKSKEYTSALHKQLEQLNKKVQHLEGQKNIPLEFRHEKFIQVQKKITQILNDPKTQGKDGQSLFALWKEFIQYVKSRDKKVRDLQTVIKKRQKELIQKDKLVSALQEGLKETQNIFLSTQMQVKKFNEFIVKAEKEINLLAEKNISIRTQFQQEKLLLIYKTKTQNQSRLKMEQKLRYYESMDEQIKQIRKITLQAEQNYETWITEQQKQLMEAALKIDESKKQIELKSLESDEKDRNIKKINEEKEKWKSECNKLGAKFHAIEQKSEMGVVKMQLQDYKSKLMCSCSRDQQKSVVLKTCPHAFCRKCIEEMNNSRNRKCPLCGIKFGKSDVHDIILS